MSFIVFETDIRRDLDRSALAWITEARASCQDGLNVNHEYMDLRGKTLDDLSAAIEWERTGWDLLLANDYKYELLAREIEADEEHCENDFGFPVVEFGMVSIVCALSALGCVPITSCRGPSFDDGFPHQQQFPSVSFYLRKSLAKVISQVCEVGDLGLVNGQEGMAELYADDLRKMLRAAGLVRSQLLRSG